MSNHGGLVEISVIIPVYNDQRGLERCLRKLGGQQPGTPCFEVVVVDNGSEPPINVASDFMFPLKVVRHEKPGAYAARNAGVMVANGCFLAFTDADCTPALDWLESGYKALLHVGEHGIVGGNVLLELSEKRTAVALYQSLVGFGQGANIEGRGFSATANLFCTRQQFDKVGAFEERLLSGGDREWCWRAARHGLVLHYSSDTVVSTPPRSSLRGAVKQARRVAAGRRALRQLGLVAAGGPGLAKQRSALQSGAWILASPNLGLFARLRVLAVAVLIWSAGMLEKVRLVLGGRPERA